MLQKRSSFPVSVKWVRALSLHLACACEAALHVVWHARALICQGLANLPYTFFFFGKAVRYVRYFTEISYYYDQTSITSMTKRSERN
jgi:hypothetical protein